MADKKALEELLKIDGEDQNNYYIGKQPIPKGPEGDLNKYVDKFLTDQRKIGGTDMQLATLAAVRDGKLLGDKTLDSPGLDLAHKLLASGTHDRNGAHYGNLTVKPEAYGEFVEQILAGNEKLLSEVERATAGKREQTMDSTAVQKTESAVGRKLIAGATQDKNGDIHIGHLSVSKDDWNKFRESVLANTPEANDRVLRLGKEAADKSHETHWNARTDGTATKPLNAEMQAVLKGIPTVGYDSLAELNQSRHRMQEHFAEGKLERNNQIGKVELNGSERKGISASGSVLSVANDAKSGMTTITYDPKGQTLSFPTMQTIDGESRPNPLTQLATMQPGDKFHLKTDPQNVNGAFDIETKAGEFRDFRVGPHAAKMYGEAQDIKHAPARDAGIAH